MCKEHAEIVVLLEDFGERLESLEKTVGDSMGKVDKLESASERLTLLVMGDEDLGVPPMRDILGELAIAYDRAKWAAGALGITNVGAIIVWLTTLSKLL
jgi:hypothetical protein